VFVGQKYSPDDPIATSNVGAGGGVVGAREADGRIEAERWEGIRRHAFALLEAEAKRLDRGYRRLRYGD
jgi:hypothetical protein